MTASSTPEFQERFLICVIFAIFSLVFVLFLHFLLAVFCFYTFCLVLFLHFFAWFCFVFTLFACFCFCTFCLLFFGFTLFAWFCFVFSFCLLFCFYTFCLFLFCFYTFFLFVCFCFSIFSNHQRNMSNLWGLGTHVSETPRLILLTCTHMMTSSNTHGIEDVFLFVLFCFGVFFGPLFSASEHIWWKEKRRKME